jgi:hypothetical protein
MAFMKKLIAFDPGKTTGVSIWEYGTIAPPRNIGYGQIEGGIEGFLEYFYPDKMFPNFDVIVCESFVLDGRTPNPDLTPLHIEGALLAHQHRTGVQLRFQRNNFKKHVPDERLKGLGLWWAGKPHAMDSARHALAYMKVSKHLPTLNAYFKD